MLLLPFHVTAPEYSDEQTHVFHDHSECAEAKKIQAMDRIDGAGGRPHCKECKRLEVASRCRD